MANTTLNTIIILRNDTKINWDQTAIKLLKGEMAVEFQVVEGQISGQPKLKVGDGVKTYAELPYVGVDLTEIRQMIATAVKAVNDRIDVLVNGADEAFDTLKEIGDYLNEHKDEYTALLQAIANKVDKEPGKGLSTNDYVDADKEKLEGIESGAQRNTVTGVKGDAEENYRVGNINITKDNIGLGNVDNTADADKEVKTAERLKTPVKIDGVEFNGSADIAHYAESEQIATDAIKTAALTGFRLDPGSWAAIKFKNVNTVEPGSLQLNIGGTGAKPIRYRGAVLPSVNTIKNNCVYLFVYDGTNYELIGDLDSEAASPYPFKVKANDNEVVVYYGNETRTLEIGAGTTNGTIAVGTEEVPVSGLKQMAYEEFCSTDRFVQGINTLIINGGTAS